VIGGDYQRILTSSYEYARHAQSSVAYATFDTDTATFKSKAKNRIKFSSAVKAEINVETKNSNM